MRNDMSLNEFIDTFSITDNALDMRDLRRWNSRAFQREENLAEHTHLVVACCIEIIEHLHNGEHLFDSYLILKAAMLHDSLELYRGDILNSTKDAIPGLREYCDTEESEFSSKILHEYLNDLEQDIIWLADKWACILFLERLFENGTSPFLRNVYATCREQLYNLIDTFRLKYNEDFRDIILPAKRHFCPVLFEPYIKGYKDDAGIDLTCMTAVTFLPLSTQMVEFDLKYNPKRGTMGMIVARTSAANKGLCVAMCPIDPGYTGNIRAIVHNVSNDVIMYEEGTSFCQLITVPFQDSFDSYPIKCGGERGDSTLGGSDCDNVF